MEQASEPFAVDIKLQGKESTLTIGSGYLTAIHCPGHSPGSVVLPLQTLKVNLSSSGKTSTVRSIQNCYLMKNSIWLRWQDS